MANNTPLNVLAFIGKMIDFITTRALTTKILEQMCVEAGSKHDTLVLCTEICWFSKGCCSDFRVEKRAIKYV